MLDSLVAVGPSIAYQGCWRAAAHTAQPRLAWTYKYGHLAWLSGSHWTSDSHLELP